MPTGCTCAACHLRRLTAPLVLIAVGALLLVHMLRPSFNQVAMVASFLVFLGVLQLLQIVAPRAATVVHPSRGSFFVPLLLIVVGALMLLRHALPQFPVGEWIAHYWPVLLILWGLTRLVEHYTLPPRTRGGMSGGEILLVVLIVVFGLAFSGMYRFGHSRLANYWGVNVEGWNPFLQSFPFNTSAQNALAPGQAVLVRGYRGNVNLVIGAAGQAVATLSDTVHADGHDAAQHRFQAAQPAFRVEGGQLVVMPAGDNFNAAVDADLNLALPPSTPVTIQLQHGDVTVPEWHADLDIHTTHGSITAGHITGSVQVASGHDSVSLDQISGNVSITGAGDDVGISNVGGDVVLTGEFVGSLNFRNLARGVRFNSSRTALALAALPGALTYDMGQITISDARGVNLRTRDEEIVIRQFSGPLEVSNRNDSIELVAATAPTDPITASTHDADITLTLPSDSRFQLQASAHNGDVHNDFAGTGGAVGGPAISLQTSNGTVAVRKGSSN